jgi:hypothetical protein
MKNLSSESHFEHKAFTTRNKKFFFDALTIQRQQSTLAAILKNLPVNTEPVFLDVDRALELIPRNEFR